MLSMRKKLSTIVVKAFTDNGYEEMYGEVTVSDRPDLCQFQCNGAFACAKLIKANPTQIAKKIVEDIEKVNEELRSTLGSVFKSIGIAGPGFINFVLEDEYIATHIREMQEDKNLGAVLPPNTMKIVVDYGGPNVGKPLHVGHLRAAIIGESIKRIAKFLGHEVIGDVHLGDWGLQMGMIIRELKEQNPDWIYFDDKFKGPYPDESPIKFSDFEETYPRASKKAKENEEIMEGARKATSDLQEGRPGYRALWKHFIKISVSDLKGSYDNLFVDFDLWMGESDVQEFIGPMVKSLIDDGYARESQGAMIIDVVEDTDTQEVPPFMVSKSDGASLYSTTDLATILQRKQDFNPDAMWYVVDQRQAMHFRQVFRCAYKTGVVSKDVSLEHLGFGTMNGTDGKPFKTRDGGVMKLNDLMKMVEDNALSRLEENELNRPEEAKIGNKYGEEEKAQIAHYVGIAALKYADLMNLRTKDYIFDLDKFSASEGRTGVYLLYATARIKSILRRAKEAQMDVGSIAAPISDTERELQLQLSQFPDAINKSFNDRAPNYLCDFVYNVAVASNKFYHEHNVVREEDTKRRGEWLGLLSFTHSIICQCLDLLSIKVPERL